MANKDINMERFAYDVCVHVLEKFNVFKAPDDTRKQNEYFCYDFLTCISRSVVLYTILIRDSFKKALEDKYESAEPRDKEKMWNFFEEYLLKNDTFKGKDCTGKMYMSLALCTDYIQFVSTKDFTVSLNKIVVRWNDFFEKNLRKDFEAEGGFRKTYSNLKSFPTDRLDDFLKEFVSEYLLPYGARECTTELAKICVEKRGIPLDIDIFGVKTKNILKEGVLTEMPEPQCETGGLKGSPDNSTGSKESKQKDISDSDDTSTSTSEISDSEVSQSAGSEMSNFDISENKLLGIPPHEEMLREIDPFFVENIPSPPKPEEHKPQEHKPEASDASRPTSKSPEELTEMVEQILSKLEHDMGMLRNLLFEHGLISKKSGRRGSKMRCKDAKGKKPSTPEGLI